MLMLKTATVLEAISKRRRTERPAAHTGLSKNTIFAATHSAEDALVLLDATANGLTAEQTTERLNAVGPNTIEAPTKTLARRIADAFVDPFAGILAALALVSLYIDVLAVPEPQRDPSTVIVIGIMLLVSGGMKFIQEARSGNAAEALKDLVSNTCTALRDGKCIEIPFDELVPGDMIRLSAGDMVPADARIITARDLFVIESALTGESEAVETTTTVTVGEGAGGSALPLSACKNIVFTGTSVQNGTAMALVVATGSDTYLGGIAKMLNGRGEKSAFDRGVSSVSMLLVRLMLVMAPAVFAINAATKGDVIDALLFATSVAVGITPQMLPVIVTTSLSQGAKDLARRQVIVKELPAIQNLGAMDVLCCDKTGTLTRATPQVVEVVPFSGCNEREVLQLAACLEEHFPHSMANAVVRAAKERGISHEEMHSEVEYIVAHGIASRVGGQRVVIGSHHFVFEDEKCTIPTAEQQKFDALKPAYSHLYMAASGQLVGVICISDPLRPEAAAVLNGLRALGIRNTVMMTGDSERTAAAIAKQVGVDRFFAEVLPEDKANFVQQAKAEGHTVVMIGDGINDSPALSAADIGIAINSGAAIAREIADVTIKADSLEELVALKAIANSLQKRVHANYRFVLTFNSALIALGALGILQPASSAMLHNLSTIGISLKSMTNLLPENKAPQLKA